MRSTCTLNHAEPKSSGCIGRRAYKVRDLTTVSHSTLTTSRIVDESSPERRILVERKMGAAAGAVRAHFASSLCTL